jgi:hypothetical protein
LLAQPNERSRRSKPHAAACSPRTGSSCGANPGPSQGERLSAARYRVFACCSWRSRSGLQVTPLGGCSQVFTSPLATHGLPQVTRPQRCMEYSEARLSGSKNTPGGRRYATSKSCMGGLREDVGGKRADLVTVPFGVLPWQGPSIRYGLVQSPECRACWLRHGRGCSFTRLPRRCCLRCDQG